MSKRCRLCRQVHPEVMNPWGMHPPTTDHLVWFEVWATTDRPQSLLEITASGRRQALDDVSARAMVRQRLLDHLENPDTDRDARAAIVRVTILDLAAPGGVGSGPLDAPDDVVTTVDVLARAALDALE